MSRDYSNYGKSKKRGGGSRGQTTRRKPARSKKNNSSGGMFWFVSGLAVGSLVTAMILVPDMRPDIPVMGNSTSDPGSGEQYEPNFEFHSLLSDDQVVLVPEREPVTDTPPPPPETRQSTSQTDDAKTNGNALAKEQLAVNASREVFLLQAGSFRSASDAEERRVQLLLMNLTAAVEKAKTSNGDTRYRVIVGPFDDRRSVNTALNRISTNGIETLLLKRNK